MADLANTLGVVKRSIARADSAAVEKISRFGVAIVREAMARMGLMMPRMHPPYTGARMRHPQARAALRYMD